MRINNLQRVLSTVRRAVDEYKMILPGDKVAVGLSGGKDSLVLLAALRSLMRFFPGGFSLEAVTIDMGIPGTDYSELIKYCDSIGVPYTIIKTDIYEIIFNIRKETHPCSLCSKMRRGALNTAITDRGINKLALGHHADDVIETLMLSLFYEGRLSVFKPVSYMDRTKVTLIRPLIYTWEKQIRITAKDLPVLHNACPANHNTKREYMKDMLSKLEHDIPHVRKLIMSAVAHPDRNSLWDSAETDETL